MAINLIYLINSFTLKVLFILKFKSNIIYNNCKLNHIIRHNDIKIMEVCRKVLKDFEEELLVCEDWLEIFDVMGKIYIYIKNY